MFYTNISNNGIITINRGDNFSTSIPINLGTGISEELYELGDTDLIYFAICEPNQAFLDGVVRKKFTKYDIDEDGNIIIKLLPSDTQNLLPGTYYYELKLQINSEVNSEGTAIINTIVPRRKLVIC